MAISPGIVADTNAIFREIARLSNNVKRDSRAPLRKAAAVLVSAARAEVKVGTKVHKRYPWNNRRKKRAAKGAGRVVATYQPGNLRGSIKTLVFRRSMAVFVGPKLKKGGGSFGPGNPDGYYAHMVHNGHTSYGNGRRIPANPFMTRARSASEAAVKKVLVAEGNKLIQRLAAARG